MSNCIQAPPFQLFQGHQKSLLLIAVPFVRRLSEFFGKLVKDIVGAVRQVVEFLGKLWTEIVGAGRQVVEFLGKLLTGIARDVRQVVEFSRKLRTLVFEILKSRQFRVFLRIVLHGLMWFLSGCFMALFCNDISYRLQGQNRGHGMLETDISRAIYSVFAIILIPYWTWNSWSMADSLRVPDPAGRQFRREVAHRIAEKLQSLRRAEEGHLIEPEPNPNATCQVQEDLGSGMGTSSPIRQDVESGGGTSTPITTKTPKTFLCIFSVAEDDEKVSIELLQALEPIPVLRGSKVLYKRFKTNPQVPDQLDNYISQIVVSMRLAHNMDKDSILQLGSFAVFKYTDAGPKMWILQKDWTPAIIDIRRQWRLFDNLLGHPPKWIIRGFNLEGASLRAASMDATEYLKVLIYKHERGVDIRICEEPRIIQNLAPTFPVNLFISAYKVKEVEEGISLKLQSEAKDVRRAYWVSEALMPGPWIAMTSTALSLLGQLNQSTFGRKFSFSNLLSNLGIIADFFFGGNLYCWSYNSQCRARVHNGFNSLSMAIDVPLIFPACGADAIPPNDVISANATICINPWYVPQCIPKNLETGDIWLHVRTGLEIYITVYLAYLVTILFILSWKVLLRAKAQCRGSQS